METSGATATAYGVARRAKWIVEVRILVNVKFDCRKTKVNAGLKGFEPRTLSYRWHHAELIIAQVKMHCVPDIGSFLFEDGEEVNSE